MGFGEAITTGFRKYVTARGRATRPEFWYWTLFSALASLGANIADAIIGAAAHVAGFALVGAVVGLALFIPGIAVTIRRLHDTDRSGWWYLLVLTGIGGILLLFWVCRRGTPGANRFGLGTSADIAGVFGDATTTLQDQRI